jgi:hypothetical protein
MQLLCFGGRARRKNVDPNYFSVGGFAHFSWQARDSLALSLQN